MSVSDPSNRSVREPAFRLRSSAGGDRRDAAARSPRVGPAGHEVPRVFADAGFGLNDVLVEMLSEHHRHRTERRGSGYTQATRHLAAHVNRPRFTGTFEDLTLFADPSFPDLRRTVAAAAMAGIGLDTWRHLDRCEALEAGLERLRRLEELADTVALLEAERRRQAALRRLPEHLEREESRLLAACLVELVLPVDAGREGLVAVPWIDEKLPVGSCPQAEQYFLELAERRVRRGGRVNVLVDRDGRPLLLEKVGLGDDHSCVSLVPLVSNGVRVPAGSLFAVHYDESLAAAAPETKALGGKILPAHRCTGLRFLRFTTLAISPGNRRRAFSTHFEAQVASQYFGPETTELERLVELGEEQAGVAAPAVSGAAR